jgi:hypothetical protein
LPDARFPEQPRRELADAASPEHDCVATSEPAQLHGGDLEASPSEGDAFRADRGLRAGLLAGPKRGVDQAGDGRSGGSRRCGRTVCGLDLGDDLVQPAGSANAKGESVAAAAPLVRTSRCRLPAASQARSSWISAASRFERVHARLTGRGPDLVEHRHQADCCTQISTHGPAFILLVPPAATNALNSPTAAASAEMRSLTNWLTSSPPGQFG